MVGDRLLAWRKGRELSQRALGKLVGCSQSMIGALENGAKSPGINTALAIQRESGGVISVEDWETKPHAQKVKRASHSREVRS